MPQVSARRVWRQAVRYALACLVMIGTSNASFRAAADVDPGVLPSEVASDGGGFQLQLQSIPAPIPLNELFEIIVTVSASAAADDSNNPVWLRASAEMPAHKHGMNTRAIVEQIEDGRFAIKGLLFHMRGEWVITFDVAKGRAHEQAKVHVLL